MASMGEQPSWGIGPGQREPQNLAMRDSLELTISFLSSQVLPDFCAAVGGKTSAALMLGLAP